METLPHDGIIRFRGLFNQDQFLVCSPAGAAEVLVTHYSAFEKPPIIRAIAGRILGEGVLFAEGEDHKTQRRKLMPAFSFRRIKELYPLFWEKACVSVQAITAEVGGRDEVELEAHAWMARCTIDTIGSIGLGRDFGAVADEQNPLYRTYEAVMKPSKMAAALAALRLVFPSWLVNHIPMARNDAMNGAAAHIRTVCRGLVESKLDRLAKGEEPDPDILSTALQGGGFTVEETVNQAMTFLAAGHETVAATMTWALYALSRHPEVQQRLRKEIRENLPGVNSDASVASTDVEGLPYLSAVCSEVLRMYPPIPLTVRQPINDTTIQGVFIPKGTRIVLCAWAINRSQRYWGPTANEFIPDRWLNGDPQAAYEQGEEFGDNFHESKTGGGEVKERSGPGGSSSPYANLTFMHGPRSCIGQGFAKAEFACLLAAFVGRFEFELKAGCEGVKGELGSEGIGVSNGAFSSKPGKDGLFLRVRPLGGF
ncbi:cytochrome p450 domain-containing protein [Sarocladium implicatum]|nr:cytochrome p450 domain-containing protein [Sarocladium implicatum]